MNAVLENPDQQRARLLGVRRSWNKAMFLHAQLVTKSKSDPTLFNDDVEAIAKNVSRSSFSRARSFLSWHRKNVTIYDGIVNFVDEPPDKLEFADSESGDNLSLKYYEWLSMRYSALKRKRKKNRVRRNTVVHATGMQNGTVANIPAGHGSPSVRHLLTDEFPKLDLVVKAMASLKSTGRFSNSNEMLRYFKIACEASEPLGVTVRPGGR
jgi:hypothetical protein